MKKIMFLSLIMGSMSVFSMDEKQTGKILVPPALLNYSNPEQLAALKYCYARLSQRSPSPVQEQRPKSPAPEKYKFSEEEEVC